MVHQQSLPHCLIILGSTLASKFLVDLSIYKQGRYSPGSDLKIYSTKAIEKLKPNYILILAWNFSTEIINQNINYLKMSGKFITPFPKINIIDYKNHKKFLKK